jgi:hypothetical protein
MEQSFLKNSLRITRTKSKDLKEVLKKGEIYPAKILNKVSENNHLIEILNRQILATSSLQFSTNKIFVQVNDLEPKIHLRIISSNLEHIDRILSIAKSEKIELDAFNQWGLAEFIKTGHGFSSHKIKNELSSIRTLASRLNSRHLVPLSAYVDMLSKNPGLFEKLSPILFPESIPIKSSSKGYLSAKRPEDIVNTLHHCYTRYNLENKDLKSAIKTDGVEADLSEIDNICSKLKEYNIFVKPGYSLSGFLVPCENEIKPIMIEGKRDIKGSDLIQKYEFTFSLEDYGPFRINLRFLENMLSLSYFFYNTLLKSKLLEFEQPLKSLASSYSLKVLPFHYETTYCRTIL